MSYKLQSNGYVVRLEDGAWIPPDAGNADWRAFQEWLGEGNTPQAADPPPPAPAPSCIVPLATFIERVSDAEYLAVTAAAQTDATIARWLDLTRAKGSIDLLSAEAIAAKAYLVSKAWLTQASADAIFFGPPA